MGFFEFEGQDTDSFKFTHEGAIKALEIYSRVKEGMSISDIEEEFGLQPVNEEGIEHVEFRIIMAAANLSGLMDAYDSVEHVYEVMDEIEENAHGQE